MNTRSWEAYEKYIRFTATNEGKQHFYGLDNLPMNTLGYFQSSESGDYIIINDCIAIQNDDALLKCVLAEEIGHYFTTIGRNEPLNTNTYHNRMMIEKQEIKALKWATDYLIDTDLLIDYLADHTLAKVPDIADHFHVTEKFTIRKLEFMKRKDDFWKLRDQIYLCLLNLPTIFIADLWDKRFIEFLESD